jgi:hypothetical protein
MYLILIKFIEVINFPNYYSDSAHGLMRLLCRFCKTSLYENHRALCTRNELTKHQYNEFSPSGGYQSHVTQYSPRPLLQRTSHNSVNYIFVFSEQLTGNKNAETAYEMSSVTSRPQRISREPRTQSEGIRR